jgi:GNAT superfamily N-acetyltransferase
MLYPISLTEIPKSTVDPDLACQAALLVFNELGDNPNPSEWEMDAQLAYMDAMTTVAAINDETVVATGTLGIPEPAEKTVGYIMDLAVALDYRKIGLGRDVVGLIERKAKEVGVRRLQVFSLMSARGFYERIGYRGNIGDAGDYVKFL